MRYRQYAAFKALCLMMTVVVGAFTVLLLFWHCFLTPAVHASQSMYGPSTIHHVVFMKLDESDHHAIANLTATLEECQKTIPGVLSLTFGRHNPTPYDGYIDRSDGYNYVVSGTFPSWKALKAYSQHPTHIRAIEIAKPLERGKKLKLDWRGLF